MSTDAPLARDVVLHALSSLENRRLLPDKPQSFIYDGIFSYGDPPQDGVGSFHHFVGHDPNRKQDGFYQIEAKVCFHACYSISTNVCLIDHHTSSRMKSEQRCYVFGLSIRLPYADLFGLLFYLLILIHSLGVAVIIVLLH